jgi:AraC family transcriptional regulator of adaptative response / DNA-3-methyladenine glycosylase II
LPNGAGVVEVSDGGGHLRAHFELTDLRDLGAAVERTRRLFDLDADPSAADHALGSDPILKAAVKKRPGLRVPGCASGEELAIRAVLGQQVSVKGATNAAAKLAAQCGEQLEKASGELTRLFPSAAAIAAVDPESLPMPRARGRALVGLAAALASGELVLDAGTDRADAREQLVALPGIGNWTAEYIAMRALRDPDAFLPTDLGVRRGLEALGQDGSPKAAEALAEKWRPYRAYALQHLWAVSGDAASKAKE